MATGKKSFVLYADYINIFEELTDEEAGQLAKHMFRYVNDQHPEAENRLIKIAFEPIKQQLKRDLKIWEEKKSNFSDAGKESAKARRLTGTQLYVLRFFNENEEFIKVGITDNSIGRRYHSSGDGGYKLGYKFDIMFQYFEDRNIISVLELETKIGQKFAHKKYSPLHHFAGHMECYCINSLNDIIEYITSFNIVQHRSTNSTVNVNDTVTVNVTDTVLSKDNEVIPPPTQKQKLKKQPDALQFPFTGPEFLKAWNKLITLPKWKKKPLSAIQQSLDNISKYDEEFAVKQINDAHAGNWQGLTFPDTDEKFLKWKNQRNGKTSINNGNIRTNKNSETIAAAENLFRDIASEIRQ